MSLAVLQFDPVDSFESAVDDAAAAIARVAGLVSNVGNEPAAVAAGVKRIEALGNMVDALRVQAIVPFTSHDDGHIPFGRAATAGVGESLSDRLGFATAVRAIAAITHTKEATARARLRLAEATSPRRTLTGTPLEPDRALVGTALEKGLLGVEAADAIVLELSALGSRVDTESLVGVETAMVARALGIDPAEGADVDAPVVFSPDVSVDYLRQELKLMASAADPNGTLPREEQARGKRGVRAGSEDIHGVLSATIVGPTHEVREFISLLTTGAAPTFGTEPPLPTPDASGVAIAPRYADGRTLAQKRYDTLVGLLRSKAMSNATKELGGTTPQVLVITSAADLNNPNGKAGDPIGTITSGSYPISRQTVEQLIDAGGYREVAVTDDNVILGISSIQRCFTDAQKMAVAARDGHQCITPGCPAPAYALQAHHVVPWRDGGLTATSNCVLVCTGDHCRVDTGPWEYRMNNGIPEIRGPANPQWVRARPPLRRS